MASVDETKAVARAIEYGEPLDFSVCVDTDPGNTRFDAFPGRDVPVLLTESGNLHPLRIKYLSWGFPMENRKNGGFNARVETAAQVPLWRESFERRHCIVPVQAFFETSRNETSISPKSGKPIKQAYRFAEPGCGIMLLAGIWKPGYFSLLTQTAARGVEEVHDRMPISLDLEAAKAWLYEGNLPTCGDAHALERTKA